jgi:hypothetical protein
MGFRRGLTGDFFGETEQPIYCVNLLERILLLRILLDSEVDDCALGDCAGGSFDGNCRRSGWRGWDEDIAVSGTAC